MHGSNNASARLYLDLLRHSLCRDRFPDARYEAVDYGLGEEVEGGNGGERGRV